MSSDFRRCDYERRRSRGNRVGVPETRPTWHVRERLALTPSASGRGGPTPLADRLSLLVDKRARASRSREGSRYVRADFDRVNSHGSSVDHLDKLSPRLRLPYRLIIVHSSRSVASVSREISGGCRATA